MSKEHYRILRMIHIAIEGIILIQRDHAIVSSLLIQRQLYMERFINRYGSLPLEGPHA